MLVGLKFSVNILKCSRGSAFLPEDEGNTRQQFGDRGSQAAINLCYSACLLQISMSARPRMEVVTISAKTPWAVLTAAAEKDLNY